MSSAQADRAAGSASALTLALALRRLPGVPQGNRTPDTNPPLATILAAGIYIGGGVILAILIIVVLILLLRR